MPSPIAPLPDLDEILPLLAACGLPTTDIAPTHPPLFFGIRADAGVVAVIGIELFGTAGLLRSLAVSPAHRRRGLAHQLVTFAERTAAARGVAGLFLLTTTAAEFFTGLGYLASDRSTAPPAIQTTAQFAGICPSSSAFLYKSLVPPAA